MIDRTHDLPLARQVAVLGISRGSLYHAPHAVSAADLAIMRRIDALHLDYSFAGSRMLRDLLRGEGVASGRDRVITMMRRMGIETLYRRPNTSKPAVGHKIYPYLLRGLVVDRSNQIWAMDITYTNRPSLDIDLCSVARGGGCRALRIPVPRAVGINPAFAVAPSGRVRPHHCARNGADFWWNFAGQEVGGAGAQRGGPD
jgi:HTH-like domain